MKVVMFQILVGISTAMLYWIVSVGLTFIFGVTRILNFAHGSFYMMGAFLTLTFFKLTHNFIISIITASLSVTVIGFAAERILIKHIYELPVPFQLALTFGLVLIFEDIVKFWWGSVPQMIPPLKLGILHIFNQYFPVYSMVIIVMGCLVGLILYIMLMKTRLGITIRAMVSDKELAMCSGINPHILYSLSFALGSFLAGLGGALTLPISSASLGMGEHIIIYAFIITVMGGLGNIKGAFISSILIGVSESLCTLYFPNLTIAIPYLILTLILIFKPEGLFGEA